MHWDPGHALSRVIFGSVVVSSEQQEEKKSHISISARNTNLIIENYNTMLHITVIFTEIPI